MVDFDRALAGRSVGAAWWGAGCVLAAYGLHFSRLQFSQPLSGLEFLYCSRRSCSRLPEVFELRDWVGQVLHSTYH
jgi:hypothetical protein